MPIDFSRIPNPHGYLSDVDNFVDLIKTWPAARYPWYTQLWLYYTDEILTVKFLPPRAVEDPSSYTEFGRPYATGQELGLPLRITGVNYASFTDLGITLTTTSEVELEMGRKEPVTDNQIGWRVNTLVDFLYGKQGDRPRLDLVSASDNEAIAEPVGEMLKMVLEAQDEPDWLASFGTQASIYGWVDVCVCLSDDVEIFRAEVVVGEDPDTGQTITEPGEIVRVEYKGERVMAGDFATFAKMVDWCIAEPDTVTPLVNPKVPTELWGWVQTYETQVLPGEKLPSSPNARAERVVQWFELTTPTHQQVYRKAPGDDDWMLDSELILPVQDDLPIVHTQHSPNQKTYEGRGEVEPLIPSQDELNKRLSDRSNKITFQSFDKLLAKGIENFEDKPVGPTVQWQTDNPDGTIETIGGDSKDAGEDHHIIETRDMMDRISRIPPVAAGDVKDSIGTLTSAVALKVVLRGLIDKVQRTRETHGKSLAEIAGKTVRLADALGIIEIPDEMDQRVMPEWREAVDVDISERIQNAIGKKSLGVTRSVVLEELGYTDEQLERMDEERQEAMAEQAAAFGDTSPGFSDNEDDDDQDDPEDPDS